MRFILRGHVSLFVAGAAFGEVHVSLFVAGAAFGEVHVRKMRMHVPPPPAKKDAWF